MGIKNTALKLAGKLVMFWKRHGSTVMLVGGLVGNTAGTVLACNASTKLEARLEESKKRIAELHEQRKNESISEDEYRKQLTKAYLGAAKEIGKLYGLPTALILASDGLLVGGHIIDRKQNAALTAAYIAAAEGFKKYREKVAEEVGVEKEREIMKSAMADTVKKTEYDENGNAVPYEANEFAQGHFYAQFHEGNPNWSRHWNDNERFLTLLERDFGDRLDARGYVYLNEVLEALGMEPRAIGQFAGWSLAMGDHGCDLSFGLIRVADDEDSEDDWWSLEFNCHADIINAEFPEAFKAKAPKLK